MALDRYVLQRKIYLHHVYIYIYIVHVTNCLYVCAISFGL